MIVLDCEVYRNYFLVVFKNIENQKITKVEMKHGRSHLTKEDIEKILFILNTQTTIGYNSISYDLLVLIYACSKKTCEEIYTLSKTIIENRIKWWEVCDKFGINIRNILKNHIDLIEPAPAAPQLILDKNGNERIYYKINVSLKTYGGRLHFNKMQDLPCDPHSEVSEEQMEILAKYCVNDVNLTESLYYAIKDRIDLRLKLSKEYKLDLKSKSDPQLAEAIISSEYTKKTNINLYKSDVNIDSIRYDVPYNLSFKSEQLNQILDQLRHITFKISDSGSVMLSDIFKNLDVIIGNKHYKMGIGGLHSIDKNGAFITNDEYSVVDKDVASYYPSLVINQSIYPKRLGSEFLDIYKSIVDRRLEAKKKGDMLVSDSLKIAINGVFGKFGNRYSKFYCPRSMLQVTISGQLYLLMLIEALEEAGIRTISANTDGVTSLVPNFALSTYDEICQEWQDKTSFVLEDKVYDSLYMRDVSNYLAFDKKGDIKTKGLFSETGLTKNPSAYVISKAVIETLRKFGVDKTHYKESIRHIVTSTIDLRDFVIVRNVTGGAKQGDTLLGKVVRWIHSERGQQINYQKNDNRVAGSEQAFVVLDYSNLPSDLSIDYERYIADSEDLIESITKTVNEL